MGLLQLQKEERRARILAAAKQLVAERGFEALTMRDLARASRVSVPTLYSLFGSKEGILLAEAQRTVSVLTAFEPGGRDFLDKVLAIYTAGASVVTSMPGYYQRLIQLLVVSPDAGSTRTEVEGGFIDMMAAVLAEGKDSGLLVDWIDPTSLSREMWSRYVMSLGRWALGDLPPERFRDATVHGMSLTLLGVARGGAAARLERLARETQEVST